MKTQVYFLKLIYKEHPKGFILFFVLSLSTSVIPPIVILLNKEIIDTLTLLNNNSDALKVAIFLIAGLFLVQYISALLGNILEYVFFKISQTVSFVLQKLMKHKLIEIPLEEYEDSHFFDNVNLANIALNGNGIKVVSSVISIIGNIISLIAILGLLLSIHWSMPIALFISTLPGVILIFIAKRKKYAVNRKTSPQSRELSFTDGLFLNRSAISEIKVYGTGNYLIEKWSNIFKYIQTNNMGVAYWECKTKSIAVLILQLSSLGVSLLLVSQIYSNQLSIGSYVALLGAVTSVQGIFGMIGGNLGSIFETAIYNNALMKIINYSNESVHDKSSPKDVGSIESISLDNVSFYYPKSDAMALNKVSFTINKGEKISIVGYNGSGKTTLVKCILGLYQVNDGEIKINNVNIAKINQEKYFKLISVLFQDFSRFKYDVRENVALGDLSKLKNDEEIYEMLQKVGLYEKVFNFEHKLDTYLTKEIPNGSELSGGEWQRVALARGFLRDADLMILDEPTAALDPINELKLFELFHSLSRDKTTITISHRIGPTKYSDKIIVMDQGKIVEAGNYDYLMSLKGLYYEMYMSQMKFYQDSRVEEGVM
ncbi:ABC transporter ATP-binding protein/permease [Paenibacillus sp. SC116]|nr:ABC transporter ATP-binding protein/permease [Paenibacillus sp. SC116]